MGGSRQHTKGFVLVRQWFTIFPRPISGAEQHSAAFPGGQEVCEVLQAELQRRVRYQ